MYISQDWISIIDVWLIIDLDWSGLDWKWIIYIYIWTSKWPTKFPESLGWRCFIHNMQEKSKGMQLLSTYMKMTHHHHHLHHSIYNHHCPKLKWSIRDIYLSDHPFSTSHCVFLCAKLIIFLSFFTVFVYKLKNHNTSTRFCKVQKGTWLCVTSCT